MANKPVVAIGSDHAGREIRKICFQRLNDQGYETIDLGVGDEIVSADYPKIAFELSKLITSGAAKFGVLVCGTGVGMAMAANRFKGVRAVNCLSEFMARMSRAHNDANVLTLGQRIVGPGLALSILDEFLASDFEGGRHLNRVKMLN
jgi:ribose 5-phosphate isomerase B